MGTRAGKQQKEQQEKEAEKCFQDGKQRFTDGDYESAFQLWSRGYRDTPAAFIESRLIQSGLRKLRRDCLKRKLAAGALERYARAILENSADPPSLFDFFLYVMFEAGLFPECYEPAANLEQARIRWQTEFEQLGEPLYAKFRLTLLDALEGKLPLALEGLRFCQDRFPPKKHESLRLKQLIDAVLRAGETVKAAHEGKLVIATPSAWEQAGFLTPFEARPWKRAGIPPEAAKGFREQKFTAKAATAWARAGFLGAEARAWIEAGVIEPDHAKRWTRAGLSPEQAFPWEQAFAADIERAVLFLKAGFPDPLDAAQWSKHFQFPSDAVNWREQGFQAEEAGFWYHDAGVKDPYSARREKQILAKPDE